MKAPREVVQEWVAAYNQRDARAAAELYHEDATNFQVALGTPSVDKQTILGDLISFFGAFPDNLTHVENLFEDGEWAILEWSGGGTWRGEFPGCLLTAGRSGYVAAASSTSLTARYGSNVDTATGPLGSLSWVSHSLEDICP